MITTSSFVSFGLHAVLWVAIWFFLIRPILGWTVDWLDKWDKYQMDKFHARMKSRTSNNRFPK